MNAERLLAHYEHIANAPDAVGRLRRFILDLAVRGKLLPQDLSEETAMGLRQTTDPAAPFALPSNWRWISIGDQLDLLNGMAFKPTDWAKEGLRIVRIQNLNNPSAPFNFCNPEIARERSRIDNGAFLISWSGTPGTSFGAFIWERGPAVLNQHIFRCDFKTDAFAAPFLRLAINGRLDEMIAKAHGGVGLQHITKGKLEALQIPLPPLVEQHRIIAKVDELMVLCDQIEAARGHRETTRNLLTAASFARLNALDPETISDDARFVLTALPAITTRRDQIKQLRQAILCLAVRGRLVPQDPSSSPSRELLERTASEQHDQDGMPSGWRRVRVGAILQLQYGKGLNASERSDRGTVPVFGSNGVIGFCEKQLTSQPVLIIGRKGSAGALNLCEGPSWTTDVAYYVEAPSFMALKFLYHAFTAMDLGSLGKGVKPGLSRSDAYAQMMSVPPLEEQHRIAARVDELMALCDQLEASVVTADEVRSRLLNALIEEALGTAQQVAA